MKNFTLLVTFLLVSIAGFSQEFGGTPPNCVLPAGFILSQGDKMVTYQNPLKNNYTLYWIADHIKPKSIQNGGNSNYSQAQAVVF